EAKRQEEILDENKTPVQETRGWDESRQKTFSQRVKEEAHDYRYFPEPDIPPIVTTKQQISTLQGAMPELPDEKLLRFQKDYNLSVYDSEILTRDPKLADYFEETVKIGREHKITPKDIANAIINKKVDIGEVLPASLIKTIVESKISVAI